MADEVQAAVEAAPASTLTGDVVAALVADEMSVAERAKALVEGYAHALSTNSPRTVAELDELKALLG